ncbi:hypothetical protein A2533_03655 [Candidatus Falkowbacteria bacterium RIFOXYD2_FULL_35_9]|uniref:Uncharacterized protein n=1 Tax=Candidatus Falkowbacteria bacterium RIFOXYC2_FULL_36_12 TaxID=1798002 RepID=A0A1F5SZ05_9BACT|nr:MAG: hypothetical protein A2478_04305 [Candidatus Falkowbacteria bacterium RIFOXYC2_FULL_36_12]OGF33805.1 MAG: hypothetical protein A2223_03740 [Candidatus Falkowbacteria bacterium RIFOXYA2_FULL_35_8]OGF45928.1 MAG: hypothetical protein A2533_03655 [Candidatus Falkowbacteria bacterium RIFOXYD2_FULL_35_9]
MDLDIIWTDTRTLARYIVILCLAGYFAFQYLQQKIGKFGLQLTAQLILVGIVGVSAEASLSQYNVDLTIPRILVAAYTFSSIYFALLIDTVINDRKVV